MDASCDDETQEIRPNNTILSDDGSAPASSLVPVCRLPASANPTGLHARESMLQLLTGASDTNGRLANLVCSTNSTDACEPGLCGSLQGLLHSFNSMVPGIMHSSNPTFGNMIETIDNTSGVIYSENSPEEIDGMQASPSRGDVDQTGYESSGSSVYAVNSDDEDYTVDCTGADGFGSIDEYNLISSLGCEDATDDNPINNDNIPPQDEHEDCPCIAGQPFMHVMTNIAEGESDDTPWVKRGTTKQGQIRENCRVPKGMSPIEIALRNAPYRKTKYIFEPILGITFDSEKEAYDFYNMYSWEVGFGIKKDSLVTNSKGFQTRRDLRCLCSGAPDQAKNKSKKTGCKAMVRLLRSNDDGWYISRHVAEHNHPLTTNCGQTKEWKSHGNLDVCGLDMVKYLRENNVSLTKVHCIMGSVFGSMEDLPITKRTMRAICRRIAKDQMDDDVQKTLAVFQQLRKKDPGFQFSVDLNEEKKIKTVIWINGKSRDQYKYFGDVVTFDTTYCTNIYKMPFGLFVGVNNHFQSTIFGGVFMRDETIASFKWVFSEFLSLMGGKLPQTVFTDQCAAMAAALAEVWKGATHLLCKWHMFKDAGAKLGPIYRKGSAFRKLFHKIINDMLTIGEFERAWAYMINQFDLVDNEYLKNIYNKREKWAKAYFRGTFCARMSSTQRSESANHMLKRFVPRNCSMNRFVVQFNKLLFDRNEAENRAEYDTKIFKNVSDRAWPIEEHAMTFYTAAAYGLFRKEIDRASNYFARQKPGLNEYEVVHVKPHKKLPWGRDKFIVCFSDGKGYICECGLYEHFGILCSHVLRVFVQLGVSEVPKENINKRWTRSAADVLPEELKCYQQDTLCMNSLTYRHNYLVVNALGVVTEGNKDLGAFEIVAKDLKKLQKKLRDYFKTKEKIAADGFKERFSMQGTDYATSSDACGDSGTDTAPSHVNTYGAAGSSAWMSDSELLTIKAPDFNRPAGRPRENRFKGARDYYCKKQKKRRDPSFLRNNSTKEADPKPKKKPRCGECELLGHTATQCRKKHVDLTTELPEF